MDLDTIVMGTQAVAAHAGTGVIAGAGMCAAHYAYDQITGSEPGIVPTAIGVIAATAIGPEFLGVASQYFHEPTIGGVMLGTIGAATASIAAGGILGNLMIHDGTGNETSFIGWYAGGACGGMAGTLLYWGSQAMNYFG